MPPLLTTGPRGSLRFFHRIESRILSSSKLRQLRLLATILLLEYQWLLVICGMRLFIYFLTRKNWFYNHIAVVTGGVQINVLGQVEI